MNDEQDTLYNMNSTTPIPPNIQPGILVAVATLVLAGSAVFWRSNLRLGNLRLLPNVSGSEQPNGSCVFALKFVLNLNEIHPTASLEDEHAGQGESCALCLNSTALFINTDHRCRRK